MEDFELPDDLNDVEIIYSDGEDDDNLENIEEMIDAVNITKDGLDEVIVDTAKLTFTKHTKSVFSSGLNGDCKLAVTGGEDDIAYVWSTTNGEVLLECTGHKDSVTETCFSYDSKFVATADMGGMIQVWSVKDKKLVWCFEGDDMEWLIWHPERILICGCQSGDVYVWKIPQGNCKVLASPNNCATTCGRILPNGKQLLCAYQDGQLKLWNIKENAIVWSNTENATITSMDINSDGSLAVVAPAAQIIKLSDGKTTSKFLADDESEIEMALFKSELGILATGSLSGQLCVWEMGRQTLRHQARIECAVTVLKWGLDGKIFIGATDGAIYVCDVKSGSLLETLTGHRNSILSIQVFTDGNSILTTSDDGTAKIFELKV